MCQNRIGSSKLRHLIKRRRVRTSIWFDWHLESLVLKLLWNLGQLTCVVWVWWALNWNPHSKKSLVVANEDEVLFTTSWSTWGDLLFQILGSGCIEGPLRSALNLISEKNFKKICNLCCRARIVTSPDMELSILKFCTILVWKT